MQTRTWTHTAQNMTGTSAVIKDDATRFQCYTGIDTNVKMLPYRGLIAHLINQIKAGKTDFNGAKHIFDNAVKMSK